MNKKEWLSFNDAMEEFDLKKTRMREIVKEYEITKKYQGKHKKVYYKYNELKSAINQIRNIPELEKNIHTELKIVKKELTHLRKQQEFEELLSKIVKESIQAVPVEGLKLKKYKGNKKKHLESAVLLLSDTHIGETVSPAETMGLNEYSFDVFKRRLQCVIDSVLEICLDIHRGQEFKELVINALGDMVSGYIHEELEITGEQSIIEWVFGGAYILSQATLELANNFPNVVVNCVVGNHGRIQKQKRYKRRYVNWDTVLYEAWASYTSQAKNVKFIIPRSFFMTTEISGNRCLLMHGDDIRGWMGIPWYGIDRMDRNFSQLMNPIGQDYKYVMLAHFHSTGMTQRVSGDKILNGSFMGGNEFSIGRLGKCDPPRQMLLGMGEDGKSFHYDLDFRQFYPNKSRYNYSPNHSVAEQRSL